MKLKNKKTGEIHEITQVVFLLDDMNKKFVIYSQSEGHNYAYNSLAELNEEWTDAPEEPKGSALDLMILTLTNFIENEPDEDKVDLEDCKQMLDKLKAWKRLKDKGFRFERWGIGGEYGNTITFSDYIEYNDETRADLDLLFSGEDD